MFDERWFNERFLSTVTKELAISEIQNAVYQASHLFERLEGVGKIRGNGHHLMQEVASKAKELMEERWIDERS